MKNKNGTKGRSVIRPALFKNLLGEKGDCYEEKNEKNMEVLAALSYDAASLYLYIYQ